MSWCVIFYQNSRGEKVVKEFLETEGESLMAKVDSKIKLLQEYGPFLGMPHSKKLDSQLYELRIRGKNEIRIFYAFIRNKICLLHVFKKKTQETPKREMELAHQRLNTLT